MSNDFQAEKWEATILFCDIRNFTKLFDEEDPLEAVKFANSVLTELGEEVERQGGKVDRFTGDGFMAHFGIINGTSNHVKDACKAALRMRRKLQNINTARYLDVKRVVSAGIGIHTGTVALGEISTKQIKQTTVLGDVVNTTARIEQLTKFFSVDILLSNESYKRVEKEFQFKEMSPKQIQGKRNEIETHWLLPMNDLED
ncbi:adenylate/guanylate cyclase domain-containing protein [Fodinibius saliphilus]|uniref:adenylate/guanylate cyclase domain-containing protein n=1 Tax=Fodinibius saliphilus TaxID=1920650 RepID=UPI001107CEDD|nr:adenylate/guanylate cyclase domain-containing protein [Fodinibius saliphilus]